MAFDKLYDYTQQLHDEIVKLEQQILNEPEKEIRVGARIRHDAMWAALVLYFQTVLQMPKFKSQRDHCRAIMEKLNPAWCQGYFKTTKKKK